MGSGLGDEEDRLRAAIEDLRSLHGGALPAGLYRYVEAGGSAPRLGDFELGDDGEMLD